MSEVVAIGQEKVASLEEYFRPYRDNIIGITQRIPIPTHQAVPMCYADWTATGRAYRPIEEEIITEVLPFIANTHTDSNYSSRYITDRYRSARETIKKHVNASKDDVLVSYGSGMTDVLNKFQRMLGLRLPEQFHRGVELSKADTPVVFVTHMEHHSNHTSWLETICEVVVVPPGADGLVSLAHFEEAIQNHQEREVKIASITACSNVTGIETPYLAIAELMHRNGGRCFVDFACSAPYVDIDMHPSELGSLDAIFFSPHKFLGGPGASGILVFNKELLETTVPDVSGGGTVHWTNPWGGRRYVEDLEEREDGGTPAIVQTIRAGLAIQLKEHMGVEKIQRREQELMQRLWEGLDDQPGISLFQSAVRNRLGILSLNVEGRNHNAVVEELNDRHGIQVRGGCSCAGTYGHYLLGVDRTASRRITDQIDRGDSSEKPGWVRISIHPTTSDEEAELMVGAVRGCV